LRNGAGKIFACAELICWDDAVKPLPIIRHKRAAKLSRPLICRASEYW
jgi:hypothetical protein